MSLFQKYSPRRAAGGMQRRSRCRVRGARSRMAEAPGGHPRCPKRARRACKPDSVQGSPLWMAIPLGAALPRRSSCQPGSPGLKRPVRDPYSALLPVGLALPVLLPGPRWALTPPFHRDPDLRGRLFSVALSVGLRRPGVTRHRCFRESGLSSSVATRGHPALRARGGFSFPLRARQTRNGGQDRWQGQHPPRRSGLRPRDETASGRP